MLDDLYQEIIVDHAKHPRNYKRDVTPTHQAEGHNPLCGDNVTVKLRIEDGRIVDAAFDGNGCAVSTASASLMTETLIGKTVEEAQAIFKELRSVLTEDAEHEDLGSLEALVGVREYPMRVKCATLAWHTMQAALKAAADKVTTE